MRKRVICIGTATIDIKSVFSYNANNEGGNTMKKLLSIAMTALLLCGGVFGCTHVHTEECGENGINCTHECHHIVPYNDENMPS